MTPAPFEHLPESIRSILEGALEKAKTQRPPVPIKPITKASSQPNVSYPANSNFGKRAECRLHKCHLKSNPSFGKGCFFYLCDLPDDAVFDDDCQFVTVEPAGEPEGAE